MKIKPLKILGKVIQVAAPVAVGVFVSPGAGLLALASLGGGAGVKELGKLAEKMGLGRPHKVGSPVAAVGLPEVLGPLIAPGASDQITALLAGLGVEGVNPLIALGLLMWISHQFGNNVEKSGN